MGVQTVALPIYHRREDAGIIQAMMLKKGSFLSRHIGTDQQRWIIGILKLDATFAGVALHGLAIGRAHNGGQGRFIGEQRRGVGQIARKNEPYEEQSQQGCTQRYGEQLEPPPRSEEHTSELQSLMRISYAVFCLKNKNTYTQRQRHTTTMYNWKTRH